MPEPKKIHLITLNSLIKKIESGGVGVRDYYGIDVNKQTGIGGHTALMVAADQRNSYVVSSLLTRGADPNIQNSDGKTALMYAAHSGDVESVNSLLGRGVDPNIQNKDGHTALMYAARSSDVESVNSLLDRGADPTIQNKDGYTAYYYADIKNPNNDIRQTLITVVNQSGKIKSQERYNYWQDLLNKSSSAASPFSPTSTPRTITTSNSKKR